MTAAMTAEAKLESVTKHYHDLERALPVDALLGEFISSGILDFYSQEVVSAERTEIQRRRTFLRHIIDPLRVGNTEPFTKLINILRNHRTYSYLADMLENEL